ncbi:MAG: dihydroorotase [Myxococcota bacterium]|nr:dihydroorotase [Myxococcota bacterium]
MRILFRGGRIIDPASQRDETGDLLVEDGKILEVGGEIEADDGAREVNANGAWILPGLIDLGPRLGEPGFEYLETIDTATRAAVAGGFTALAPSPQTKPVIDCAELVRQLITLGSTSDRCSILPLGAFSEGLAHEALAEMATMKRSGAVALSTGRRSVSDPRLMLNGLEYASQFELMTLIRPVEQRLALHGVMNESALSTRLGLNGIPSAAESTMVARDIRLAEHVGANIAFGPISSGDSVDDIVRAKGRGAANVSFFTTVDHLIETEESVADYSPDARLEPPLRGEQDREALRNAAIQGTLDALCSDHWPQGPLEKDNPFSEALPGRIGLQTALSRSVELWLREGWPVARLVALWTSGPAKILGRPDLGNLTPGSSANITVFHPFAKWSLQEKTNRSRSQNSHLWEQELQGQVKLTMHAGRIVFEA